MAISLSVILLVVLEIAAFYCAFQAVRHARTPQGSVAWVVFLIAAPYLAVPAFLFLGSFKYQDYIVARRDSEDVTDGIARFIEDFRPKDGSNTGVYNALGKIAEIPAGSGNDIEILVDGKETFGAIFNAFENAQNYILIQSYIIRDDRLGKRFADCLIAQVNRGVHIRLLYDAVGCAGLPSSYLTQLTDNGIEVLNAHARGGPRSRFQVNFRNHRKTIVVDGEVGFTGGLNVGDEYMGEDPNFGAWRDTHARVHGPLVQQLQLVFAEDWYWASKEALIDQLEWDVKRAQANLDGVVVATGPGDTFDTGSLYFCTLINAARERIWIASPYFVPESDIMTALKLAAMRGVDVRILTPEIVDHKIVWLVALAYFDEMIEAGVQIWRYNEGFTHQKVILVDENIISVGTTNLDNRSCRLNFEATAVVFGLEPALKVAEMLEADFSRSFLLTTKLDDRPLLIRYGAPVARLFSPLL